MMQYELSNDQLAALHPDLRVHYVRDPYGRFRIMHPLVAAPAGRQTVAELNAVYAYKKPQFELAVALDNWDAAFSLLEQPYCWKFLWRHREKFPPEDYWAHLRSIWRGLGGFCAVRDMIPEMLGYHREHHREMMNEGERDCLDSFPLVFRVYRGYAGAERRGWCWTPGFATAAWFAHRHDDECGEVDHSRGVLTALVRKEDVIALFLDSPEHEVVVEPASLQHVAPFLLDHPAPDTPHRERAVAALRVAEGARRRQRHCLHGPAHWLKVDHNVLNLCQRVPEADLLVCRLFAYLHDCQRDDEDSDRGHGIRAAEFVRSECGALTRDLSADQLDKLLQACRRHELGRCSADPTIAVCWDADRLDLVRYSMIIDDECLSTVAARQLKWLI